MQIVDAMSEFLPRPLRKTARALRRRVLSSRLQVVYHEQYNHAFTDIPADPLRAERILAFLASEGLVLRRSVHRPEPVSLKALEQVHTAEYLDSVHDPAVLTSILGTDVPRALVDRFLDYQRLQTGGTLLAFRRARKFGLGVNLGGGFHHADASQGGGFCTFNDIAVGIADLRRRGLRKPVLVVDLDLHDGDGTRSLFQNDPTVHTFSIHARHWAPLEEVEQAVESTSIELGAEVGDDLYLETLRTRLPEVVDRFRPRFVVYLAGCDPARGDQLGDWRVSPEGMLARDLAVYRLVREKAKVPLVVLLAGGYGQEAWRYSARFLSAVELGGAAIEPPSTEEITLKRYRHIASLFDPAELSGGTSDNEFGLSDEDLLLPGWSHGKESRFLGYYTRHGIELVLERTGYLDRLRDLGFVHPTLEFQLDDPGGQTLRVFGDADKKELISELRMQRDRRSVPGFELLSVEWLLMQNPRASFSATRPRLPGQKHPGLGMLTDLVALLILVCDRLHLDGLVFVPSQFHVAAYGRSHMRFLDPETQDRFAALYDFFRDQRIPFAEATNAVAAGRVVDEISGEVVSWRPEPMVLPVSDRLAIEEKALRRDAEPRTWRFALRPAVSGGTDSGGTAGDR